MKDFSEYNWNDLRFPVKYAQCIFDFARNNNFKRGLEVGFDSGTSALAFLRACPEATLLSVDISSCPDAVAAIERSEEDVRARHTFVEKDSRIYLPELRGAMPIEKFDYIYIDGDHLYDAVVQDIANAFELLADGGKILIDDCDPNHAHFGVWQATLEQVASHRGFHRVDLPNTQSSHVVIERHG